jgi:hypothetical protein
MNSADQGEKREVEIRIISNEISGLVIPHLNQLPNCS